MKRAVATALILVFILSMATASSAKQKPITVEIEQYSARYFGTAINRGRMYYPYDGTLKCDDCLWFTIGVTVMPGAEVTPMRIQIDGAQARLLPGCTPGGHEDI